jgi:hypothetical protein
MKMCGEAEVKLRTVLITALGGGECKLHTVSALPLEKRQWHPLNMRVLFPYNMLESEIMSELFVL